MRLRKGFGSEVEGNSGRPASMNAGGVTKLRYRAAAGLGEYQAAQIAVQRMMRTTDEHAEPPRHVVVIEDVTRGLGIDPVDAQRIRNVIENTNVTFLPKTQTMRLSLAKGRLVEMLRAMRERVDGDVRMEITKRAMSWWRKSADTDLSRSRTVGAIQWKKSERPRLLIKAATGGKYYRRVATGNKKHPYKYYYSKAQYDRAHGDQAHAHGPDVSAARAEARLVKKSLIYVEPGNR